VTHWGAQPVEHTHAGTTRLSIPFTWNLPDAYQRAAHLRHTGHRVIAGGPAVALMPQYLADLADIETDWPDAIARHNPEATFTSRGCIRTCPFCAVWRTEGQLRELHDWPVRPIICDNNLLACSRAHFDRVIDRLKPLTHCDFNQGLDARLLTPYHAGRLAELTKPLVRLAFDHIQTESAFLRAFETLRRAGLPKSRIRVYVLIGYQDTPEDALYRLTLISNLGLKPNPMRYNPLDTLVRDSHVGPSWTDRELTRYVRYWANLRYFAAVPFKEFH
jgi:hypothetical protein